MEVLRDLRVQTSEMDEHIQNRQRRGNNMLGRRDLFRVYCTVCGPSFSDGNCHERKQDDLGRETVEGPRCSRRTAKAPRLE